MRSLPAIAVLIFAALLLPGSASAQEDSLVVKTLDAVLPGLLRHGEVEYDPNTRIETVTNGMYLHFHDAAHNREVVLTADSGWANTTNFDAEADGHVRLQSGDEVWVGEHLRYNLKTRQMSGANFRTGKAPGFAAGLTMRGDLNQKLYTAHDVYVTGDDFSDPTVRVRASTVRIVPDKYVEMWNAVVWVKGVPVFYFPYYKRNLGPHADNWNFLPGYRSAYGGYLLDTYTWYLNDQLDGKMHLDFYTRRGVGAGPEFNLHMGRWGEADLRYYYLHDSDPNQSTNGILSVKDAQPIPNNRQRFYLGYQATPYTNVNVKSVIDFQSDPLVEHDFFETAYRENVQPYSFLEVNPYWNNWSLDAETTPRINNFFDQVDRLPDVRLTGFRQQVANTPFYYDSQSSAGWYRRYFAETNALNRADFENGRTNYQAGRVDTYHQVLLPWTFFNWLNVAPRAGGRLTYYSAEDGLGATNDANIRTVFNTGVDTSFKATRVWPDATNSLLQVDGLRHVNEPSADYVYVPRPSATPNQLPQFDSDLPSLLLLPIDSSDYNNIDSVDSQNVIRFGLRNTLETKRDGEVQSLVDWNLMLDWNLTPNSDPNASNLGAPGPQKTFDDLYSHLSFRPRTWLTVESQLRESINSDRLNMAFHQVTFTPNERWSWGVGDWYLAANFPETGPSENLITSTFFYRLNDDWGLRMTHYLNAQSGHLQEQLYTMYRDFRFWTGALTFRAEDNQGAREDYTIAFSFTLKFAPRSHLGDDAVSPYHLVGQ